MTHTYKLNDNFHYVTINRTLEKEEQNMLSEILSYFPHAGNSELQEKFASLPCELYDAKLLTIAANAYDFHWNTMLGLACWNGSSVAAVQKLIDLGANLNTPDLNSNKLALHWGICNNLSLFKTTSYKELAVVQCLLENGAKTHLKYYENKTPLEYSVSRGYIAAANLIRARNQDYTAHAIFHFFKKLLPWEINIAISALLNVETGVAISCVNKETHKNMIGYKPNKTVFARFFDTQSDKKSLDAKENGTGLLVNSLC